jgi:hypothetical protein
MKISSDFEESKFSEEGQGQICYARMRKLNIRSRITV